MSDADDFCRDVWPRLAASLGFYCHDRALGEELAQEALARAWARWNRVSALDSPEAWVYRVALNLSHSRFRRARAERRAMSRVIVPSPDIEAMGRSTDAIAVRAAVAQLPERQRAAIVLRYFAGMSVREVAEVMKCPENTVKTHTRRGLDALRRCGLVDDAEPAPRVEELR